MAKARRYRPSLRLRQAGNFATAVRQAYRGYKSYTKTKQKKKTSGVGVTRQHDSRMVYRKKRMPRYKRKRWGNFVKKVQAVNAKQQGTKTLVLNASKQNTAVSYDQMLQFFSLYGRSGADPTNELGSSDLRYCMNQIAPAAPYSKKFTFKSGIMDLTVTNSGTKKLEVDLYHITYWGEGQAPSFGDALADAESTTPTMGTATALTLKARGATPFDFPALMRFLKCTIQKKTKYFIDAGDTITYQLRDAKEYKYAEEDQLAIAGGDQLAKKNMTQSVLLIAKTLAGATYDGAQLTTGVTRKYSFTNWDNTDEDGFLNV